MSNSNKLSYEMEEPAFLRRIRQQATGAGRQERYIAPRNKKTAVDDDEDAPAYVLEDGQDTISRAEFEAMAGAGEALASPDAGEPLEQSLAETTEGTKEEKKESLADTSAKTNLTEIGGNKKKRKAAKIVGEDDASVNGATNTNNSPEKTEKKSKVKGQKRRIKLSFDAE